MISSQAKPQENVDEHSAPKYTVEHLSTRRPNIEKFIFEDKTIGKLVMNDNWAGRVDVRKADLETSIVLPVLPPLDLNDPLFMLNIVYLQYQYTYEYDFIFNIEVDGKEIVLTQTRKVEAATPRDLKDDATKQRIDKIMLPQGLQLSAERYFHKTEKSLSTFIYEIPKEIESGVLTGYHVGMHA